MYVSAGRTVRPLNRILLPSCERAAGGAGARCAAVGFVAHAQMLGPGEFKLLGSGDGANFELLGDWRRPSSADVSFTEHVMLGAPVGIKVLTLVLRQARPWKFFGLNAIDLIVEPGPVLLVSGVTSPNGFQCVVVGGGEGAALRSCADAVADGAGDEVFVATPEGMLKTAQNPERCLVLADSSGALATGACRKHGAANPSAVFETNAASQLVLPRKGKCVAVHGGTGDAASVAAANVKATHSQSEHPVSNVVDADPRTYWAAEFFSEPIDVTLSLGVAPVRVGAISIDFEYPAKGFQVDVATQGPWRTVYAAGANNLNATHISLSGVVASAIRVRVLEPHPVWARVEGRAVVGIRAISVDASSAKLVAKDCAEAGNAVDAGDKFFMVSVPGFDAAPAAAAKDSAAMARAAANRLSGLLADLEEKRPILASCGLVAQRACVHANCTTGGLAGVLAAKEGVAHASALLTRGDRSTLDVVISAARRSIAGFGEKMR